MEVILGETHQFYMTVQNRWYNHVRAEWEKAGKPSENFDARENKWWRLMESIEECYPSVPLLVHRHFNPEDPIKVRAWLKMR